VTVGMMIKCGAADCSHALCPVLDKSWEHVISATREEAQGIGRNSNPHAGCSQKIQRDEVIEEKEQGEMNEAGGVHLQQAGGLVCIGEQGERTSEARTHKGESAAVEQESQERSQGHFMSTLALSTLCPSDCAESLQDDEDGEVQGCGPCDGVSQHSVDVFDSFWSRPARLPSCTKSGTPPAAVFQAEDVCGSCEQRCVGVCHFGAMRAPAGDLTQAMREEDRGSSSNRQHLQAGVGIRNVALDLTLQPAQMAPFVCFGHDRGRGCSNGKICVGETNGSSSGSGFGGLGHVALRSDEWVMARLRENEIVLETLLLGQRVLRIISADRGQRWPWLHLSASNPSLCQCAILCQCSLCVQTHDCVRCSVSRSLSLARVRARVLSSLSGGGYVSLSLGGMWR